jgi:hypothetical protein
MMPWVDIVEKLNEPEHEIEAPQAPSNGAREGRRVLMIEVRHCACTHKSLIDLPQQVVRRDHFVEVKLVEELPLIPVLPPHHHRLSCSLPSRNHCLLGFSTPFSKASTRSGRIFICLV